MASVAPSFFRRILRHPLRDLEKGRSERPPLLATLGAGGTCRIGLTGMRTFNAIPVFLLAHVSALRNKNHESERKRKNESHCYHHAYSAGCKCGLQKTKAVPTQALDSTLGIQEWCHFSPVKRGAASFESASGLTRRDHRGRRYCGCISVSEGIKCGVPKSHHKYATASAITT